MPDQIRPSPELALLGCLAFLWGTSYIFIKIALTDIPPVTLIAVRVVIAALVLSSLVAFLGQRWPRGPSRWARLMIQAFCNSIGAWTILAWGQQHVDAALASVLNSTSPIFAVLLTLALSGRRAVPALQGAGVVIGILGVVLVVGPDALGGLGQGLAGQLACLVGAALYAVAAIHGRYFADLPPIVTAAATMACASLVLVPAALVVDRPRTLSPGAEAVSAALALGLFSTALAMVIYFRLVRTLGSIGVASQSYLRAGVGVVLGVTFLGEVLSIHVLLGILTALAGVVLINLPWAARRPPVAARGRPSRRNRRTP
jgi:drug/metabolite transporter (DMT)-like permease